MYGFDACNRADGEYPSGSLINVGGVLYGMTGGGGPSPTCYGGTVFSLSLSGTLTYLHSFGCGADGSFPHDRLLHFNGGLYGTTIFGGLGCGTVFKLKLPSDESVLYSFKGGSDGCYPEAGLTEVNHTFFGTTQMDGANDDPGDGAPGGGTVFSLTPSGLEVVTHSFSNTKFSNGDGCTPHGALVESGDNLYGTNIGGVTALGTVFSITPGGTEAIVHNFTGTPDGRIPFAGLTRVGSNLYGTTAGGGAYGFGAVFMVTP